MFNSFIPFAKAKNVYEIEPEFYQKLGITTVLIDLDNTLDSYKLYHPGEKAIALKKLFDEHNIRMIIVSNNRGKRVSTYAKDLGVEYLPKACKPLGFKLKRLIKDKNIDISKTIFIGDQMMTDVIASKNAGIRMVLTDKIVKEDQWTTHINRLFGKQIRKYHIKHHNFIDWREKYGKD